MCDCDKEKGILYNYYIKKRVYLFLLPAYAVGALLLIGRFASMSVIITGVPIAVLLGLGYSVKARPVISGLYFSFIIISAHLLFVLPAGPNILAATALGVLAFAYITYSTVNINMIRLDSMETRKQCLNLQRAFLKEKAFGEWKDEQVNILRKEIDHRVRNSVTIILSLIHDERMRKDDNETVEKKFDRIDKKIAAFYQAHQIATEIGDERKIEVARYLERLIMYSFPCAGSSSQRFSIKTDPAGLFLPLPLIIPVGVIIIETLDVHHELSEGDAGSFEISFTLKNRNIFFSIKMGKPGGLKPIISTGSSIIHSLIQQLGAEWVYDDQFQVTGLSFQEDNTGIGYSGAEGLTLEICEMVRTLSEQEKKQVQLYLEQLEKHPDS